jgi:hypothetical protein
MLTEIIETGKMRWWDIQKGHRGILLHLLVATLNGIGLTLSSILERCCIIQTRVIWSLADGEQDTNTLLMVVLDCFLEHASFEVPPTTGWIAQTHPMNTWIRGLRIGLYS